MIRRRYALTQPLPAAADTFRMQRPIRTVRIPLTADQRRCWTAAARREGLTLRQWLVAAAELAWVRGGTR